MIPIHELLECARKYGDRIALVTGNSRISYASLLERVHAAASALEDIVEPGDRVALLCTNSYQFIWASLAIEMTGAIRVPINIKLSQLEVSGIIADCAPAVILHEDTTRDLLPTRGAARILHVDEVVSGKRSAPRHNPAASDICSINYTSGSTGVPKGVMMSHENWGFVYLNMLVERDIDAQDSLAFIGPLTHAAWSYLFAGLLASATNVIFAAGDIKALLAYSREHPVTIVTCVPTTLMRIVDDTTASDPLARTLKWIGIGAAPVTQAQLDRAAEIFGNRIVINYGQTEAMMTCTFMDFRKYGPERFKADYIGRPYVFSAIRVMGQDGQATAPGEIGELHLRGSHTMVGYWTQRVKLCETAPSRAATWASRTCPACSGWLAAART